MQTLKMAEGLEFKGIGSFWFSVENVDNLYPLFCFCRKNLIKQGDFLCYKKFCQKILSTILREHNSL